MVTHTTIEELMGTVFSIWPYSKLCREYTTRSVIHQLLLGDVTLNDWRIKCKSVGSTACLSSYNQPGPRSPSSLPSGKADIQSSPVQSASISKGSSSTSCVSASSSAGSFSEQCGWQAFAKVQQKRVLLRRCFLPEFPVMPSGGEGFLTCFIFLVAFHRV
jgi:hypothetical protein